MKRILFLALVAAATAPTGLTAQSVEAEIERAVLAAPARQRADATVVQLRPDGTLVTLREGSNGMMCWDLRVKTGATSGIDSQCTNEANRERLAQNHAFQSAGGSEEEVEARFAQAEANGTRALSQFGTIYYHVTGDSPDALRSHTTVAVPGATGETIGLPERGGAATLWLMEAGTSSAHLMVAGM